MNELHKTPLHDLHVELGGKMVPFAGYSMPVQFPLGVKKEHEHTRAACGLFDVSHMGQVLVTGSEPAKALETLVRRTSSAFPKACSVIRCSPTAKAVFSMT